MNIPSICNKIIECSFYALFFFVPLVLNGDTSEIFEFNKIWLTFILAAIIGAAWGTKMILQRRIQIQKTPLDIPLLLFLLSQIISTFFSLDSHVSLWGYYSRFNGGLLSIIAYIFLYYAFVSNATKNTVIKTLFVCLAGGVVVTLWGLPSHFGYDPTCFIFRGKLDVACWTAAFQPMVRIFSTLGQPNWLAAYLSILMPIAIAFGMKNSKLEYRNSKQFQNTNDKNTKHFENLNLDHSSLFRISDFGFRIYLFLTALFFVAILFTGSRSGFLGLLAGGIVFFLLSNQKEFLIKFIAIPLLVLSLFFGTPVDQQIGQFTAKFFPKTSVTKNSQQITPQPAGSSLESGGTESGKIRLIVWRGAIDAWLHNPIFGTGVETFAFAYYTYRPAAHNLTSEWDYLYNKAHNEYLNYLTTTGIFGLGTYAWMIGTFLFISIKQLKTQMSKLKTATQNTKLEKEKFLALSYNFELCALSFALIASYVSILVSNFLGFSVVIMNIFLFMIPAFVFVLGDMLPPLSSRAQTIRSVRGDLPSKRLPRSFHSLAMTGTGIFILLLATCYLLLTLYRFWLADTSYTEGYNLDRAGAYQNAYLKLADSAKMRPDEPTFLDELSYNTAVLAVTFASLKDDNASASGKLDQQKIASYTAALTENAILLSNKITTDHPNNIVFWKTRIRILNLLSQQNPTYIPFALSAAQKAASLAPTDAKVSYSLAVLYGQNKQPEKAIETLQHAIALKPDYRDAYYALALFYHNAATNKKSVVIDPQMQEKAIRAMQYILDHIASNDAEATKALKTWAQ